METFLSPSEVAQMCGCTTSAVKNMVDKGYIGMRYQGRIRIPMCEARALRLRMSRHKNPRQLCPQRERLILQMMENGESNRQIVLATGIKIEHIRRYRAEIARKAALTPEQRAEEESLNADLRKLEDRIWKCDKARREDRMRGESTRPLPDTSAHQRLIRVQPSE